MSYKYSNFTHISNNIAVKDIIKITTCSCRTGCLATVATWHPRFTQSVSLLKSLHWLPVRYRIVFKICTITYQALSCKQPSYLHPLLTPVRKPAQLRWSRSDHHVVPKTNTNIAFAVGAPALWNMLHSSAESVENIAKFRLH